MRGCGFENLSAFLRGTGLILLCAVASSSVASAQVAYPVASGTPKHAIVVFIDGGRPELYTPENAHHIFALGQIGARFTQAEVGFPSDSMPGILGALTGAPPRVTGVPYDIYYDRRLGRTIE